ncbi:MAG: hypothetical protein HQK49_12400 [Oligoflexia bacterium]|nr:hypothetical protein [Oligoflexia bacterium]
MFNCLLMLICCLGLGFSFISQNAIASEESDDVPFTESEDAPVSGASNKNTAIRKTNSSLLDLPDEMVFSIVKFTDPSTAWVVEYFFCPSNCVTTFYKLKKEMFGWRIF